MKSDSGSPEHITYGRAPHGARGLKFRLILLLLGILLVAPRTGRVD